MSQPSQRTPEISPADFVRLVESGADLQLVDVRLPARVAAGRIDLLPDARFHNVLGSTLAALPDVSGTGIATDTPAVVVCGHGNSSREATARLRAFGLDAQSLTGGMAAYMNLLVERPIAPPASLDRLIQFDRIGKGALSYLLVSEGEALIIDPSRDVPSYLAAVKAAGARLVGVADTHVHADYISGAPELAHALGVPYYLHPSDAVYPYDGTPGRLEIAPLAEATVIKVGRCAITARHTPGHTEGSMTFMVGESLAFTGDFIFVDSMGRPDLAGRQAEWAELLWASLERARQSWASSALVLPAHYSSWNERRADRVVAAVFGDLLRSNAALGITDHAAFLAWATAASKFPDAYRIIKAVNVGLQTVDEDGAELLEIGRNECAVARPAAPASR